MRGLDPRWMTPKRRAAALALAQGHNRTDAARIAGVTTTTLRSWHERPEFLAYRDDAMRREIGDLVPKAVHVLARQMDEKNPWVAQQAARAILQMASTVLAGQDQSVQVIVTGAPVLGHPGMLSAHVDEDDAVEAEVDGTDAAASLLG